jgi:energy-coupling factor transporter ATP-binding protein EcfA2
MMALLEMTNATITTPNRRVMFEGLNLRLARDRVALMGRNGVGKSTLLAALAGHIEIQKGRVATRGAAHYVPQLLESEAPRHEYERLVAVAKRRISEEWPSIGLRPFSDLFRSSARAAVKFVSSRFFSPNGRAQIFCFSTNQPKISMTSASPG